MNKNKRKCGFCKFYRIGVPAGYCIVEPFLRPTDKMVFEDCTNRCPLEKEDCKSK